MEDYRNNIMKSEDCELIDIFYDIGKSGMDKTRSGYNEILQAAKKKEIDYIVTKHPGKLTRNVLERNELINSLRKNGVGIFLKTVKLILYHTDNIEPYRYKSIWLFYVRKLDAAMYPVN